MVLSIESDMEIQKDLPTGWAISPIKVETQVVPTTGSVVELAGPLATSDQAEEERRCMLIMTASMGRLNLEATGDTFRDMVTALVGTVDVHPHHATLHYVWASRPQPEHSCAAFFPVGFNLTCHSSRSLVYNVCLLGG